MRLIFRHFCRFVYRAYACPLLWATISSGTPRHSWIIRCRSAKDSSFMPPLTQSIHTPNS